MPTMTYQDIFPPMLFINTAHYSFFLLFIVAAVCLQQTIFAFTFGINAYGLKPFRSRRFFVRVQPHATNHLFIELSSDPKQNT